MPQDSVRFSFLLHYNLYTGAIHRSQYKDMLTKLTGMPFTDIFGEDTKKKSHSRLMFSNNIFKVYPSSTILAKERACR